jgi:spore maturation protein CgeB
MGRRRITIVGNPSPFHVGAHFLNAARELNLDVTFCDATHAYSANRIWRTINWRLLGRTPARLNAFSNEVLKTCAQTKPRILLSTGLAPLNRTAILALREMNVRCANFLTDDPWNPAHRAAWFFEALPHYDFVFSPRRANIGDLRSHGCPQVNYLPFAYAPEIHYPEKAKNSEREQFESDVMFAGGADPDRIPLLIALRDSGLKIVLHGHDWDKHRNLKDAFRGHADPAALRKVVSGAKACLCLVRRANRDGHAMRSYEVPAMAGVILAETTDDHKEMFGEEGALYFKDVPEMITKAEWLVAHETEASQMAERAHSRISTGGNTYRDRLEMILATCLNR